MITASFLVSLFAIIVAFFISIIPLGSFFSFYILQVSGHFCLFPLGIDIRVQTKFFTQAHRLLWLVAIDVSEAHHICLLGCVSVSYLGFVSGGT